MTGEFGFPALPLSSVRPGTTLLVAGSRHDGARELALSAMVSDDREGTLIVTTDSRAGHVIADCEALGADFSAERTGVVDCVGDEEEGAFPARVLTVNGPEDLTGIGIRFGALHRQLSAAGVERVRTGIVSLTTLLSLADFRSVSRFVHTLSGRITTSDGLGIFLVDPSTQDDRVVNTVSQFCDGRVDVRYGDDAPELRVRGLSGQPREWTPFQPET